MPDPTSQSSHSAPYPDQIQGKAESSNLPVANNRNRELFRIKASRIVDLFPDELVVQEKTISVIRNEFMVSHVDTLPVRDIGRVVYVSTPVFAGLRVVGKNTAHELAIKGLNKKEALKGKDVIEGLLLEDSGVVDVPEMVDAEKRREILAKVARDPENRDELQERAHQ